MYHFSTYLLQTLCHGLKREDIPPALGHFEHSSKEHIQGSLPVPSAGLFSCPQSTFRGESPGPAPLMAQVPLTFLGPGALVVDGLPLLKDLDGGVAAHTKPAGQC